MLAVNQPLGCERVSLLHVWYTVWYPWLGEILGQLQGWVKCSCGEVLES